MFIKIKDVKCLHLFAQPNQRRSETNRQQAKQPICGSHDDIGALFGHVAMWRHDERPTMMNDIVYVMMNVMMNVISTYLYAKYYYIYHGSTA